jgi:hypothetical protein
VYVPPFNATPLSVPAALIVLNDLPPTTPTVLPKVTLPVPANASDWVPAVVPVIVFETFNVSLASAPIVVFVPVNVIAPETCEDAALATSAPMVPDAPVPLKLRALPILNPFTCKVPPELTVAVFVPRALALFAVKIPALTVVPVV